MNKWEAIAMSAGVIAVAAIFCTLAYSKSKVEQKEVELKIKQVELQMMQYKVK